MMAISPTFLPQTAQIPAECVCPSSCRALQSATSVTIPHPSFPTPNCTYTFSAKERDPETGLSYFGSRYYSSDLGIWLSVDPMAAKYPSLSPYVYCADNPMKLVDPNGEYLEVADNEDSHNDLLSIVGKTHQNRVIFNKDGSVSVNMEGLSQKAIEKDVGLSLINDMVNSDKRYYYETSDVALCRNEEGKRDFMCLTDPWTLGVLNASTGGLDSKGKHTHLPIEGFDGQVVITKTGSFHYGPWNRRRNIVFHELAENYLRTDVGMNYGDPVGSVRGGTHQAASKMEADAWGSYLPGTTNFTPGKPILTDSDKNRIMNYINDGIYK